MALNLIAPNVAEGLPFDVEQIERIILALADRYNVRLSVDATPSAGLTVGMAVAGGLLGLYLGGRFGMFAGAVGGAATAVIVSLRQVWNQIREQLLELFYIVYNYLRSLNMRQYEEVGRMLYNAVRSRDRLVRTIVEFIATKVGQAVLSNLDARHLTAQ